MRRSDFLPRCIHKMCSYKEVPGYIRSGAPKSLPAVVVLYFTASEKDNLRTESYSYKEQKLSQCTGKHNYVMKNETNFDYYYALEQPKNDPV